MSNISPILLSFIVPVYNTGKYVIDCINSIYNQGLDVSSFELILINDGSDDGCMSDLNDIIDHHTNIKVIEQANHGVSISRNVGLERSRGKYVFFVDSDDYLVGNSILPLLVKAIEEDVDLLIADFFELSEGLQMSQKVLRHKDSCDKWEGTGLEYLVKLYDGNSYVWRSLYKRSFLMNNDISFIPDICFEDIPFTMRCLLSAKICQRYYTPVYYYIHRKGSTTDSINLKKLIDLNIVIENLWLIKKCNDLNQEVKKKLVDVIFDTLSFQWWYMISIKELYEVREVVFKDLRNRIPVFFLGNSIKQFFISFIFYVSPYRYIQFRRFVDVMLKKCKHVL